MSEQAEKRPCPGCMRVIAMVPSRRSNKRRVRHRCPHGEWCIFGHRLAGNQGMNHPLCAECRKDRAAERTSA